MMSDVGLSMISKEDWIRKCKNATGEEKKTFMAIRIAKGNDFNDANCKQAYKKIKDDTELYFYSGIKSLEPFRGLTNLMKLDLCNNKIIDISPLAGLTNLTRLYLYNNEISNISDLGYLKSLSWLELQDNQINNMTPIANLTKITYLDLSHNQISDLTPLNGLIDLTILRIHDNQISDLSPLTGLKKIKTLYLSDNYISDFSPTDHISNVFGTDKQDISKAPSKFYMKLMEDDDRSINLKIGELVDLIEDVHQMKFYYTFISNAYRLNQLSAEERAGYIKKGLEKTNEKCQNEDSFVIYRLILDKAKEDNIITRTDEIRFDRRAELTNTEHAPFIVNIQEAIRSQTAHINNLEANVDSINKSLNKLRNGLKKKIAIETGVGFMGAVLNAVSAGLAGSALQSVMITTIGNVVDYGDVIHVREVVKASNDSLVVGEASIGEMLGKSLLDKDIENVLNFALDCYGMTDDNKLSKAVKDPSPLTVITAAAVAIDNTKPQDHSIPVVSAVVVDDHTSVSVDYDSDFDSDDEDDYPLHAAIKYENRELLEEELDEDHLDINKIDSRGRSAADFAAIKGQEEMIKMLESKGCKYKKASKAKMRHICKNKALTLAKNINTSSETDDLFSKIDQDDQLAIFYVIKDFDSITLIDFVKKNEKEGLNCLNYAVKMKKVGVTKLIAGLAQKLGIIDWNTMNNYILSAKS